jgi:hypothetical protein
MTINQKLDMIVLLVARSLGGIKNNKMKIAEIIGNEIGLSGSAVYKWMFGFPIRSKYHEKINELYHVAHQGRFA